MRKLPESVLVLLGGLMWVAPYSAHAVGAGGSIPLGTFRGMQPTLAASVAGHEGTFLFDTGGGVTILSPAMAKSAGCEPWGNVTGFRMTGQRLDLPRCDNISITLGKATYLAPTAVVFDIMSIAGKNPPPLDGSVALDVFVGKTITIEPAQHSLIVETKASLARRAAHATAVPIRLVRDAQGVALSVVVGVPTAKGLAWMELDTGNDDAAIVVSKSVASVLGVDPTAHSPQSIKMALAPGIVLAGGVKVVDDLIMDGNIGMPFLKAWNITLDLKRGRAWFATANSLGR
jgi:Aspartyl protease